MAITGRLCTSFIIAAITFRITSATPSSPYGGSCHLVIHHNTDYLHKFGQMIQVVDLFDPANNRLKANFKAECHFAPCVFSSEDLINPVGINVLDALPSVSPVAIEFTYGPSVSWDATNHPTILNANDPVNRQFAFTLRSPLDSDDIVSSVSSYWFRESFCWLTSW